jgi:ankyrin repeat protein
VVLQLLIERGADVNTSDNRGGAVRYWVTVNSHRPVVQLPLEKEINVNAKIDHVWAALIG